MGYNILIAGGTGEVGKRVIELLRQSDSVNHIHCLVRRPTKNPTASNLSYLQVDYEDLSELPCKLSLDTFICCLGTTIKTAGSAEAFTKVDYEYTLAAAKAAIKSGANTCIFISSVGANANSKNLYLRTKGKVERGIQNLNNFEYVHTLRPSLLVGPRKEFRLGEHIGALLSPLLNPFLLGRLAKYKSIHMDSVAKAISQLTLNSKPSERLNIYQGSDLIALSNKHDAGNHLN